jgi:hypothetical protein
LYGTNDFVQVHDRFGGGAILGKQLIICVVSHFALPVMTAAPFEERSGMMHAIKL